MKRLCRRCLYLTRTALVLGLLAVLAIPEVAHAYTLGDAYGMNVPETTATPDAFPIVAEGRFGWVRLWAYWQLMEPTQGNIDYSVLDAQVNAALANNLKILLVFATIPSWANGAPANCGLIGPTCATPPTNTAYYRNFVTNVVTHYRGEIGYYEVWNEPDYNGFWNGSFSQYITDILQNGSSAVHAADPTAKVVGPTTYSGISKFMTAVNAACSSLDVLSAHFYPTSPATAAAMFSNADSNFKPYIQAHCNKNFWVTEFGINSLAVGESAQANEYKAAIQGLTTRSYLNRFFFFEWQDAVVGVPNQAAYGIVGRFEEGYRRKPSFASAQDAILGVLSLPGVATAPSPLSGSTNAPIDTTLAWSSGRNAVSHDVYFGLGTPTYRGRQLGSTFTPPASEMRYGQLFSWRIDEVDTAGHVTTGTSWSFRVGPNPETPSTDIVVQVSRISPYYMQVIQGFADPSFSSFQKVVAIDPGVGANSDNLWNAQANYRGDAGFDVFTAAGGESVPNLTIALGGLRSGLVYNVYGRYATAPAGSGNGIAMGLTTLTRYDETNSNHTVIRNFGTWQEWEVLLGQATVSGGQVTLQIGIGTIPTAAAWTGVRLSLAAPLPIGHFYTLTPCRILDTRTTGGHLTSTSTSPSFYSIVGTCGVPVAATAVSLNLTGVGATGNAFLHFFPGDLTSSAASVVAVGPGSRATRAAMANLELATDGRGTLGVTPEFTTAGQLDLLIDVNGYFAP